MATKAKTGRPSDYLPEVAADICSLLADGESLRKVCERPGMPAKANSIGLAQVELIQLKQGKAELTGPTALASSGRQCRQQLMVAPEHALQ